VFNIVAFFNQVVLFLSLYNFVTTKEMKGTKWLVTFISTYEKLKIKKVSENDIITVLS